MRRSEARAVWLSALWVSGVNGRDGGSEERSTEVPKDPNSRMLTPPPNAKGQKRRSTEVLVRAASQTVPAGGQTPMMTAMTTIVTSSCAMFSTVSDDGRPSKASWVMNLAAVNPAHRITAVRSAATR